MSTFIGKVAGIATFTYNRVLRTSRRGRWPLTLGVRIAVLSESQEVLLVRHTYTPGWHFPGGAVDPLETMAQAAVRELQEEALIGTKTEPDLKGVYLNLTENKSDHIAFFVARDWEPSPGKPRELEIAEARFFPILELPKGTTGGTRRRINELMHGVQRSPNW